MLHNLFIFSHYFFLSRINNFKNFLKQNLLSKHFTLDDNQRLK